jgi:hypothetical protein
LTDPDRTPAAGATVGSGAGGELGGTADGAADGVRTVGDPAVTTDAVAELAGAPEARAAIDEDRTVAWLGASAVPGFANPIAATTNSAARTTATPTARFRVIAEAYDARRPVGRSIDWPT